MYIWTSCYSSIYRYHLVINGKIILINLNEHFYYLFNLINYLVQYIFCCINNFIIDWRLFRFLDIWIHYILLFKNILVWWDATSVKMINCDILTTDIVNWLVSSNLSQIWFVTKVWIEPMKFKQLFEFHWSLKYRYPIIIKWFFSWCHHDTEYIINANTNLSIGDDVFGVTMFGGYSS